MVYSVITHYIWEKVPGESFVILGDEAEASRAISAAAGLGAVAAGDVGVYEMNTLAATFARSQAKAQAPEMTDMNYRTWLTIQGHVDGYNSLLQKEITEKAASGLVTLDDYQRQIALLNGMPDIQLLNSAGQHAQINGRRVDSAPEEFHAGTFQSLDPPLHPSVIERAQTLGATHYNPWEEIATKEGRPQLTTEDAISLQIGTLDNAGALVPLITVRDNAIIPNP